MSMKFSEIMLDLDTGDASIHDVHAKEALGKVNVSSAIFEYAAKLAELPANSSFIQEAADEAEAAGLPTDPAEATGLATEAVAQELIGFYDVVVENAKKVKAAADRDMKAIIGLGKKYGISASAATSGNFMIAFAKPLAQALVRDFATNRKFANRIKFKKGIFPDSSMSEGLIFSYGNCMARLASVFGMNIGDCIEDPTVQEVLSFDGNFIKILKAGVVGIIGDPDAANAPKTGFNKGGVGDVDALYKQLLKGSSNFTLRHAGKGQGTTVWASVNDIAEMITYTYVARQVSAGIVKAASATKKAGAANFIKQLCAAEEQRHSQSDEKKANKISAKFKKIAENVKDWAEDVSKTADSVVKVFSDAVSALGKVATGETEGVTDEGGAESAPAAAEE